MRLALLLVVEAFIAVSHLLKCLMKPICECKRRPNKLKKSIFSDTFHGPGIFAGVVLLLKICAKKCVI